MDIRYIFLKLLAFQSKELTPSVHHIHTTVVPESQYFSFWIYKMESLCQKSRSRNIWVLVLNNHIEILETNTAVIYYL